jgi:hypothetical protein
MTPYITARGFIKEPIVFYWDKGYWWQSYVVYPYGKREREAIANEQGK